ncbi:hypothetical protein ACSQ67_016306 [Phaseolus vulgaris]
MAMPALDKAVMVVFNQLPHKLPTREIIALYASSDPQADFIGTAGRLPLTRASALVAIPATTVLVPGIAATTTKKRGRPPKGHQEGRPGLSDDLRAIASGRLGYSDSFAGGADRGGERSVVHHSYNQIDGGNA